MSAWGWPAWFVTRYARISSVSGCRTLLLGPFAEAHTAARWLDVYVRWQSDRRPSDLDCFSHAAEFLPAHAWRTGCLNGQIGLRHEPGSQHLGRRGSRSLEERLADLEASCALRLAAEGGLEECLAAASVTYGRQRTHDGVRTWDRAEDASVTEERVELDDGVSVVMRVVYRGRSERPPTPWRLLVYDRGFTPRRADDARAATPSPLASSWHALEWWSVCRREKGRAGRDCLGVACSNAAATWLSRAVARAVPMTGRETVCSYAPWRVHWPTALPGGMPAGWHVLTGRAGLPLALSPHPEALAVLAADRFPGARVCGLADP